MMRLDVEFGIEPGSSLPINYNHILMGLCYRLLEDVSPEVAADLHRRGQALSQERPFKFFTFSQLRGGPGTTKAEGRRLHFSTDRLRWHFDSPLGKLSAYFADALITSTRLNIGGMAATVERVSTRHAPDFSEGYLPCVALSPVVASVYDPQRNHRYLNPGDLDFWKILTTNAMRKYEAYYGEEPAGALRFAPKWEYIAGRRTSKMIAMKGREVVRGHLVPFDMEGPPELLHLLYHAGVGSRNSQGFGMVEYSSKG